MERQRERWNPKRKQEVNTKIWGGELKAKGVDFRATLTLQRYLREVQPNFYSLAVTVCRRQLV